MIIPVTPPEIKELLSVHNSINSCIAQNTERPTINPPIVDIESRKVLNPFENDFLFKPTRMEADSIPAAISPKIINNTMIVIAIPAPIHTSAKTKRKN